MNMQTGYCKRCGVAIIKDDPMFKQDGYCIECRAAMHDAAGIVT